MPTDDLIALARHALLLAIELSLPALAAAALVGVVVATFQRATALHDSAIAFLPRLLAVVAALLLTGAWLGRSLVDFARHALGG